MHRQFSQEYRERHAGDDLDDVRSFDESRNQSAVNHTGDVEAPVDNFMVHHPGDAEEPVFA